MGMGKRNHPFALSALRLLRGMLSRYAEHPPEPFSLYSLLNLLPSSQRRDRVRGMVKRLELLGWVESWEDGEGHVRYLPSEKALKDLPFIDRMIEVLELLGSGEEEEES